MRGAGVRWGAGVRAEGAGWGRRMAEGVRAWTGPALGCGVMEREAVGAEVGSRDAGWACVGPEAWSWDGVWGSLGV